MRCISALVRASRLLVRASSRWFALSSLFSQPTSSITARSGSSPVDGSFDATAAARPGRQPAKARCSWSSSSGWVTSRQTAPPVYWTAVAKITGTATGGPGVSIQLSATPSRSTAASKSANCRAAADPSSSASGRPTASTGRPIRSTTASASAPRGSRTSAALSSGA